MKDDAHKQTSQHLVCSPLGLLRLKVTMRFTHLITNKQWNRILSLLQNDSF